MLNSSLSLLRLHALDFSIFRALSGTRTAQTSNATEARAQVSVPGCRRRSADRGRACRLPASSAGKAPWGPLLELMPFLSLFVYSQENPKKGKRQQQNNKTLHQTQTWELLTNPCFQSPDWCHQHPIKPWGLLRNRTFAQLYRRECGKAWAPATSWERTLVRDNYHARGCDLLQSGLLCTCLRYTQRMVRYQGCRVNWAVVLL